MKISPQGTTKAGGFASHNLLHDRPFCLWDVMVDDQMIQCRQRKDAVCVGFVKMNKLRRICNQ